jgi:acyl-CoA synthetase (AMP-forming)/AMP-acid ligase II
MDNGWLRTGDRGRIDENGFLFVTGRIKEAIVTAAGETIYPEEVEPYYVHPLFAELCVAARPGRDGNDLPTLFVVPARPDLSDDDLEEAFATLRAAAPARCRVASLVRWPGRLPRTPAGKPKRHALAAETRGSK